MANIIDKFLNSMKLNDDDYEDEDDFDMEEDFEEAVSYTHLDVYKRQILDCPAGIERGFQNAIAAADRALIVTTPEVSAIRDADRILGCLLYTSIRRWASRSQCGGWGRRCWRTWPPVLPGLTRLPSTTS